MTTVKADFEKRVHEIELYLKLVTSLVDDNGVIYFDSKQTHKYKTIDDELKKVMKANIFVLLYNLMESSIRQMMIEVYDQISVEGANYSDVSDQIKKLWLKVNYKNFRDRGSEYIHNTMNSIEGDIVQIEFDAKDISGNIDALKVRNFCDAIGISTRVHYTLDKGSKLHQVKTNRNRLAHGEVSFSDNGRNYTVTDLRVTKDQVVKYLRKIISNAELFISQKSFLN